LLIGFAEEFFKNGSVQTFPSFLFSHYPRFFYLHHFLVDHLLTPTHKVPGSQPNPHRSMVVFHLAQRWGLPSCTLVQPKQEIDLTPTVLLMEGRSKPGRGEDECNSDF
jgi:hypothetical protein